MGKQLKGLNSGLIEFIKKQKVFFIATAMQEGKINLSPKGMDSFRIIDNNEIIWLNLTGSGNETAAHIKYHDRMTIMFCAFEGKPMILRLYGKAKVFHPRDSFFQEQIDHFPMIPGVRQIFSLNINMVQTSCGYGVPFMEYVGEREMLDAWAKKKPDLEQYWKDRNATSLDGHDTGILN